MTKKTLVDQLKQEGKHFVPDIKDVVLSNIPRQEKVRKHIFIWQPKLALSMLLIIMVIFGISFYNGEKTYPTYVTLNINPSVELSIDKTYQVTAYRALNLDGEVLISKSNLIGLDVNQALDMLIDQAYQLGYATDASTIEVTAYNDLVTTEETVNQKIKAYFMDKVSIEPVDQSIMLEAKTLNMSPRKLTLIRHILSTQDGYTFEDLSKLNVASLNEVHMVYIQSEIDQLRTSVLSYKAGLETKRALLNTEINQYIDQLATEISSLKSLYQTDIIQFSLSYENFMKTYFPTSVTPILPVIQYQRLLQIESKLSGYDAYLKAQVTSLYQLWENKLEAHLVDTHANLTLLNTLELPNVSISGLSKLSNYVDSTVKDQILIEIADRLNTLLDERPNGAGRAYLRIIDNLYTEFNLYYKSEGVSQSLKDSEYIQSIITKYEIIKE